jgi:hypothetical protein
VVLVVRCGQSAANDGIRLDLHEPARIEEPLDDDEAGSGTDTAEDFAVHLCDSGTMISINEEHTCSHHVTKGRAALAKGFVDDLEAPSSLHADVGVDVIVRPDRSGCGNEDETLVADRPAKTDGRLQRRT